MRVIDPATMMLMAWKFLEGPTLIFTLNRNVPLKVIRSCKINYNNRFRFSYLDGRSAAGKSRAGQIVWSMERFKFNTNSQKGAAQVKIGGLKCKQNAWLKNQVNYFYSAVKDYELILIFRLIF